MIKRIQHITFIILLSGLSAFAQPFNDDCQGAIDLGVIDQDGFCSQISEYSNEGATGSLAPACGLADFDNDVWFTFVSSNSAIYIQIFGEETQFPTNLDSPAAAIYMGDCDELVEIACRSVSQGSQILEIVNSEIPIGEQIYLRIDSEVSTGNFHFCTESFPPIPSPESDCDDGVVLCDKSSFIIENLDNVGDINDELTGSCVQPGQQFEEASVWYSWTCDIPGSLTFTLTPTNPNSQEEDLDFILYELPNGLGDCTGKDAVRCMFSGISSQNSPAQNEPCLGPTGLAVGETDVDELAGCDGNSNNFLAPLQMQAGQVYALVVNNFSQSGHGFEIEFGGTGTFLGADPDFEFSLQTGSTVITCDNTVIFTDLSASGGDPIEAWNWNFGSGADTQFATGQGPHEVNYETFGQKFFTLTVTTERGCQITEVKDVFIESCCNATSSSLSIDAQVSSLVCPDEDTGQIIASASGGPECEDSDFMFSIDGVNYQSSTLFGNLAMGTYTIFVQDCKGCVASTQRIISPANPLTLDAGDDITVNLGDTITLDASYEPLIDNPIISWDPPEGIISCDICLDPEIQAPGTTAYTISLIDENGCLYQDDVLITTIIIRDVVFPNIFGPNQGPGNDIFMGSFGASVRSVNYLTVFDRWGNIIYTAENLDFREGNSGWDGKLNGDYITPGVYAYIAEVEFIDDQLEHPTGTVTFIR